MCKETIVFLESGDGSSSNWLGTTRSLGRQGVKVIRLSSRAWFPSKYCSTMIMPDIKTKPNEFLEFLIKIGEKTKRNGYRSILLPSADSGLVLISRNKNELEKYFQPIVPDWPNTEKIVDKSKTYPVAQSLGIPVPETFFLDKNEIKKISETISYPCLVKPAFSHIFTAKYKVKLIKANSRNELVKICEFFLHSGQKMLIQEEIPGGDDAIYMLTTCFSRDAEPLAIFTSRKLRQHPPNFGVGSLVESVWEPRIIDYGTRLLKKLRFYGIAGIEFKKDQRKNEFVLLEINGRSHTQNYLATRCGLNLPYILYKDITGERQKIVREYRCEFELGVKWVHTTIDFLSMVRKRKAREITLTDWLRSYLAARKTFAVFSLDDPYPFFSELKETIQMAPDFLRK